MERVIPFLFVYTMTCVIHSLPIDNGLTVKFNPISSRHEFRSSNFGKLFAKIPQEVRKPEEGMRREAFNKYLFPQSHELESGHTNQVAKIKPPAEEAHNASNMMNGEGIGFFHLPLIRQPYSDYKILVATAPPHLTIGSGPNKKKMLVYVVLPDDGAMDRIEDIPRIYFVNENSIKMSLDEEEQIDPILIINSNRTITGLKSKEVPKFVRFKNKFTTRYNFNFVY